MDNLFGAYLKQNKLGRRSRVALTWRWAIGGTLWFCLIAWPSLMSADAPLQWLKRLALICAVVVVVWLAEFRFRNLKGWGAIFVLWAGSGFLYRIAGLSGAAWPLAAGWYGLLLLVRRQLTKDLLSKYRGGWFWQISSWIAFTTISGFGLTLANTLDQNFAEEEFFDLATGFYLSLFWLFLAGGYYLSFDTPVSSFLKLRKPGLTLTSMVAAGLFLAAALSLLFMKQYQSSFFPAKAPRYPGITEEHPFLCETVPAEAASISGEQVKAHFTTLLSTLPEDTLRAGQLALLTGEKHYAEVFYTRFLEEAKARLYIRSGGTDTKIDQFYAALRVHQVELVAHSFPELFSAEDWQQLRDWFADVNRQALTVEWVDWLYAIAFNHPPQGPYVNQEVGTGLVAELLNSGLAAPELVDANKAFLAAAPVLGWRDIFRNMDDAYGYQGVWITNAWFINHYQKTERLITPETERNMQLAFLWLVLQALPDGEPLAYNLPIPYSMLEYFLAGAVLLDEPALTWLAEKAMDRLELRADPSMLGFSPGALDSLVDGAPPSVGSCLIYGNSGLPVRKGPLAPDKVVMRDGWSDGDAYALLNLRFSGWHRYKATNTLSLLYQNGPVISDKWTNQMPGWLPQGRKAFRDKRVPRENLNGLLLPKAGLAQVLWDLTGIGSSWAQNPPTYAENTRFFTSSTMDASEAVIAGWNNWQHTRNLYLIHPGLVAVVDTATTPSGRGPASVVWHLHGNGEVEEQRIRLDTDRRKAWMIWADGGEGTVTLQPQKTSESQLLPSPNWELKYTASDPKHLNLTTLFLLGRRAEGTATLTYVNQAGVNIVWETDQEEVSLLHNDSQEYLEFAGLGTDGRALLYSNDGTQTSLCYLGGQLIRARLEQQPSQVLNEVGHPLSPGITWQFAGNELTIQLPQEAPPGGCFLLR